MRKLGRTRIWTGICAILLIGCLAAGSADAGLFGLFKGRSSRASAPKPSNLIVFPFDQPQSMQAPEGMGLELASALRTMLNGNKRFSPILYREKLSPIKRAREDGTLKPNKDVAPFTEDQSKPLELARLLAADYFVVGAIEDVKIDAAKKTAQMTLSMDLVDANSGKLVKTMLINGSTPENANSASQEDAIALAAGDAITKLKAQLLEETKPSPSTAVAAPKVLPEASAQPKEPKRPGTGNSGTGARVAPVPPPPGGPSSSTGPGGPPTPTPPSAASAVPVAPPTDEAVPADEATPTDDGEPTPPAAPGN